MAVLEGTYCISRTGQPFRPMFYKNHASLYQDDALEKLWPSIAKSVWKGIFEFVQRSEPIPRMIVACAAVEKTTGPVQEAGDGLPPDECLRGPLAGQVHQHPEPESVDAAECDVVEQGHVQCIL